MHGAHPTAPSVSEPLAASCPFNDVFSLDYRVPVRMLRNPEQQWVSFGYKKPHPFLHVKHDGIYNNNILLLATAYNIPGVPVTGLCPS